MRNLDRVAMLIAFVVACCGCASAPPAPPGGLPEAQDVPRDPRGGWIEAEFVGPDRQRYVIEGELLAIDGGRLYVQGNGTPESVAIDSIASARLGLFDAHPETPAGLAFFGVLSTLSNGYFLVFTAPMWIGVGVGTSGSRADDGTTTTRDADWDEFNLYARFPRGLPAGFVAAADTVPPAAAVAPAMAERPPPSARLKPAPQDAFWFTAGLGPGFMDDRGMGTSFVGGIGYGRDWLTIGTRIMAVDRDEIYQTEIAAAHLYDLPLLVGLRGNYRGIHATVSAGPAAYAISFGDLFDLEGSVAAQAELFVMISDNFGVGSVFGYNWNDVADFYVVSFGVIAGGR